MKNTKTTAKAETKKVAAKKQLGEPVAAPKELAKDAKRDAKVAAIKANKKPVTTVEPTRVIINRKTNQITLSDGTDTVRFENWEAFKLSLGMQWEIKALRKLLGDLGGDTKMALAKPELIAAIGKLAIEKATIVADDLKQVKVAKPKKAVAPVKMLLTENELKVLEALVPSSAGNGHDFGFQDEVDYKALGLKKEAYAALVGHLASKKIIELWDEEVQGAKKGTTKIMHAFLFAGPIRQALQAGRPLTDYFTTDPKAALAPKAEAKPATATAPKAKKATPAAGDGNRRNKVGVIDRWVALFEANEANYAKLDYKAVKTDEEISEAMHASFPDRQSKVFDAVALVRGRYNRGLLTKGVVPAQPSRRFVRDGKLVLVATARGKALVAAE